MELEEYRGVGPKTTATLRSTVGRPDTGEVAAGEGASPEALTREAALADSGEFRRENCRRHRRQDRSPASTGRVLTWYVTEVGSARPLTIRRTGAPNGVGRKAHEDMGFSFRATGGSVSSE